MKSGNMLFDMTGEAPCKVLYARMEFEEKNYTKALVIRFLRKMGRWNKLSCHCHHYFADGNFQKDSFVF
jgi:hypothetical protein